MVVVWMPCGLGWARAPAAPARSAQASPPLPSVSATPADFFRQLLSAKPAEREQLLAGRSPEHRKVLENSVQAYEALTPDERELRLRTLELRFRLTSLLRLAPSNRAENVKLIPDRDRVLVESRVRIWDQWSPGSQKAVLENERMLGWFTSMAAATPRSDLALNPQTSEQLRQIELQMSRWWTLPEERRAQIFKSFVQMFTLSDEEKAAERLLPYRLSPEERVRMQQSLRQLGSLAPAQREECLRNFSRFADLSPAERRQFLVNVQEWERLKPEDREAWRRMVSRMPPLPHRLVLPPLPRSPQRPVKPAQVVTN